MLSRFVHSPSFALILLSLFFFITTISAAQTNILAFPNCPLSNCNGLKISYPFWKIEDQTLSSQFCGYEGLGINCSTIDGQARPIPMMYFGGDSYYVRNLTNMSITLVDYDVFSVIPDRNIVSSLLPNYTRYTASSTLLDDCPRVKHVIDLEKLPLNFSSNNTNLSFHFNCTTVPNFARVISCLNNEGTKRSCVHVVRPDTPYFDWENMCSEEVITTVIDVFDSVERLGTEFAAALRRGFELNWTTTSDDCEKCEESGGLCGHNPSTGSFMCFCSGGTSTKDHCKEYAYTL